MGKSLIVDAFGTKRVARTKAHSIWIVPDEFVGVEVECENVIRAPAIDGWEAKADGTLRGPSAEYVTHGPLAGASLLNAIQRLCTEARAREWATSVRTAIHIHLNFSSEDDDFDDVRCMLMAYLMFEPALFNFAGEYRRWVGFTYAFGDADGNFDEWRKLFTAQDAGELVAAARGCQRYAGLNVLALANHGTLEFRHLPTTFDDQRIVLWINMLLCLRKFARQLKLTGQDIVAMYKDRGHTQFVRDVFCRDDVFAEVAQYIKEDDLRNACATIRGLQIPIPTIPRGRRRAATANQQIEWITDPFAIRPRTVGAAIEGDDVVEFAVLNRMKDKRDQKKAAKAA